MHPWSQLFSLKRGAVDEISIHGIASYCSRDKTTKLPDTTVVTRSLLKPWQALATVYESPLIKTDSCCVMSFASHSGEARHLAALDELCALLNVSMDEIKCPSSYPLDHSSAVQMEAQNDPTAARYHPCSGKHLAMLGAARGLGISGVNYCAPVHPVQILVRRAVEAYFATDISWLVDSCGLPVAAMSLEGFIRGWQKLALDQGISACSLKHSWIENPLLVGGTGRIDSAIVALGQGNFIAKEGADGLLIVQCLVTGDTIFVKIASGYNPKYMGLALLRALSEMNGADHPFSRLLEWANAMTAEWVPKDQTLTLSGL